RLKELGQIADDGDPSSFWGFLFHHWFLCLQCRRRGCSRQYGRRTDGARSDSSSFRASGWTSNKIAFGSDSDNWMRWDKVTASAEAEALLDRYRSWLYMSAFSRNDKARH